MRRYHRRSSGEIMQLSQRWCDAGLPQTPVGAPFPERQMSYDERGWETERCRMAQVTAPILDFIA